MGSISFTGHRNLPQDTQALSEELYSLLERAIYNGFTDFFVGGAKGFDCLAASIVLSLKEQYSDIKLHLILPCPPEEQYNGWSDDEISEYKRIFLAADTVEQVSEHNTKGCMKKRNERLIEYADQCICYSDPGRKRSGTSQTVRMAEKKNIAVINLFHNSIL